MTISEFYHLYPKSEMKFVGIVEVDDVSFTENDILETEQFETPEEAEYAARELEAGRNNPNSSIYIKAIPIWIEGK